MLALLDRTSRKARFFFGTRPGTRRRLPGPKNKPPDKETIEERGRADFFPSLNADTTIVPSALIEPPAPAGKRPVAVDFGEDHAPYEQVVSQTEPSLSPAASSTAPCQTIQHFFAGASHFTVGHLNNYAICAEELQEIRMQVQLLQAHIARRGLSQPVGYTRENGVRIVDALGGELILPPSIIRQYSDVHDLMLKHFHGKIGEERVVESRYCMVTERDGTLVQPEDWDRVLSSGEGLIMCMTVTKLYVNSMKETCPQCGKTRLGTFREGGWLVCRRCEKRFPSSTGPVSPRVMKPPKRDDKIANFRHIRKAFVRRPGDGVFDEFFNFGVEWDTARLKEASIFEGEVRAHPGRFEGDDDSEPEHGRR